MKKFLIRLTFMALLLLFGVLLGFQQANVKPISISVLGEKEMTVIEAEERKHQKETKSDKENIQDNDDTKQVEDLELKEKQDYAENVNAFNFYSDLGFQLGELVHTMFSSLLTMIIGTIHSLLHP